MNRFTTNLKNILAYGQPKDNHCCQAVGAWPLLTHALSASWSSSCSPRWHFLGICFFETDYGYLKESMQAVTCNSIKITLLVQTKGPPSSVCHPSITGISGTIRIGWAGRNTFSRKSFSSNRQFRGFQSQRQYILIQFDSEFLPEIWSNQFCSLFTPWFICSVQLQKSLTPEFWFFHICPLPASFDVIIPVCLFSFYLHKEDKKRFWVYRKLLTLPIHSSIVVKLKNPCLCNTSK